MKIGYHSFSSVDLAPADTIKPGDYMKLNDHKLIVKCSQFEDGAVRVPEGSYIEGSTLFVPDQLEYLMFGMDDRPPDPTPTTQYIIEHDGFIGTIIGTYYTREGKQGVVLQQVGTRVVHVYGLKHLKEFRP